MATAFTFLGVLHDFATLPHAFTMVKVKPGREQKINLLVSRAITSGRLSSAEASTLMGKLYFMLSTAFGCVGVAVLYGVMADFSYNLKFGV